MKFVNPPIVLIACLSMIPLLMLSCGKSQQEGSHADTEHEHGAEHDGGGGGHHGGGEAGAEDEHGGGGSLRKPDSAADHGAKGGKFVCPMHKNITSDKAGKCSKCGMALKKNEHGTHKH